MAERADDHHLDGDRHEQHGHEREAQREQPVHDGRAAVVHAVGGVERVARGGEQVARQPPGDEQAAERDAAAGLRELRVHERRDDGVGQIRPHQRAHGAGHRVLGLVDRVLPDHLAEEPERGADGHGRGHEREHGEERHLGRVAGDAVALRGAQQMERHPPADRPLGYDRLAGGRAPGQRGGALAEVRHQHSGPSSFVPPGAGVERRRPKYGTVPAGAPPASGGGSAAPGIHMHPGGRDDGRHAPLRRRLIRTSSGLPRAQASPARWNRFHTFQATGDRQAPCV